MRVNNLTRGRRHRKIASLLAVFWVWLAATADAQQDRVALQFSDEPLEEPIRLPDWFSLSFLDLQDDIDDARKAGKRGLIVYFGQERCPYCKALLEVNFGKKDILSYTQRYFNVVGIDVRGSRLVTNIDGGVMTEKDFSISKEANFTPSLLFYDLSGKEVFRLIGYYPPYKFRAALEYVADRHYEEEPFAAYLARAEYAEGHKRRTLGDLTSRTFFDAQPYVLDRSHFPAQRPLLVLFEQGDCHACDVLHAGPLSSEESLSLMRGLEVIQLDMWADTPLLTPDGRRRRARDWAEELNLFYAPTLIFFDERGEEIIRVASVVHFYRLRNVLRYVLSRGYRQYKSYQAWRQNFAP